MIGVECGGVWCVVWEDTVLVSSRGQSDGVRIVVSCDHESGLCLCVRLFFLMCIRICSLFIYVYIYIYIFMYMRVKRIKRWC